MTWCRLVRRNNLRGNYTDPSPYHYTDQSTEARMERWRRNIACDMRRLERNSRDPRHLDGYARIADVTPDQVRAIFDAFFENKPYPSLDYTRFPAGEYGDGDMEPDPPIGAIE